MSALLGAGYDSSDDDSVPKSSATTATKIVAAPEVNTEVWSPDSSPTPLLEIRIRLCILDDQIRLTTRQDQAHMQMTLANTSSQALTYNATYDDMMRPAQGPVNPFKPAGPGNGIKRKNVPTGFAEEASISESTFSAQHRTFQSLGYSRNPTLPDQFVGNMDNVEQFGGRDVVQMKPTKEKSAAWRAKRQRKGDSSIVEGDGAYLGPWAKYQNDQQFDQYEVGEGDDYELASDEEFVEEEDETLATAAPMPAMSKEATDYEGDSSKVETTEFHGSQEFD